MKYFKQIFLVCAVGLLSACGKTSTDEGKAQSEVLPDKEYVKSIVTKAANGDISGYTKDFKRVTEQRQELPPVWWDLQFGNLYYPYNGGDVDCGMLAGLKVTDISAEPNSPYATATVIYTLEYDYYDEYDDGGAVENKSVAKLLYEDGKWRIDDFGFAVNEELPGPTEYSYIKEDFESLIKEVNNDIVSRYDDILQDFRSQASYDPESYNYKELEDNLNNYIKKYSLDVKRGR